MRLSEKWLREWVNPNISTQQLAEQLTMAGLEVDTCLPVAGEFSKVVVGLVESATPHPDADRLRVCEVNVGKETVTIVCGGVNVRAGLKVPVALVGAILPGDFKIKKSKLRGVESNGMICSTDELGLGEGPAKSIMELPNDIEIGTNVRDCLQLDDQSIDIELTPNRGDCLSVRGIARELAVSNQAKLIAPDWSAVGATLTDTLPVKIMAESACGRYVGRIIRNLNPKPCSPIWLQERLRRSGLRSIHPVVDVTNYVMLELGQPMHAFDLNKLDGEIQVRFAKKGETIKLIDEQEINLMPETLIIADRKKPQAIAGVMGGFDSAVSDQTTDIFLESAFFDAAVVRASAKQYGLNSDSCYRFERGVDFESQTAAIERATQILLEIMGGKAGPIIEATADSALPQRPKIKLRRGQIQRLLGIEIKSAEVEHILTALGMTLTAIDSGWEVMAPSYRFDINIEMDLIEELARVYGYNQIPTQSMRANLTPLPQPELELSSLRLKEVLADRGYSEVITYSFVDAKLQSLLDPEQKPLSLANPLSADLSVMRSSLWPGLINVTCYNQNRQCARQRLFEMGLSFREQGGECVQEAYLGMVAIGALNPKQWGEKSRAVDFFDMKADVMALLNISGNGDHFHWQPASHPALHPGQTAGLYCQDELIGYLGSLHPSLLRELGLNATPILFEAQLAPMKIAKLPDYKSISKFPTVHRDLALVVDRSLLSARLIEIIQKNSGSILNKVEIFDIYQGQGIEIDKKSIALGLTFQDASRTLRDEEINDVIHNIISTLEEKVNAKLRT
ncbi:MAG: phenylalanine--tRNA ligase subunit beta [Gammaproteobacteria bacterium]|nr:phenylalanine--tRNA ligase subunit beta [Gammaproteobacteria bacterium]